MSRKIILNTLVYVYISAGVLHNATFTQFIKLGLREVLENIVNNARGLEFEHLPENPSPFLKVKILNGVDPLVLCCKVVGAELKIVNADFKQLKLAFDECNFEALEKDLIDMPEGEIDPQSPYVLRDWLLILDDLKGADWRRLEGDDKIEILDAIFNKDMEELTKGDADQPGLFKVRIFTPNARNISHLDAVVRIDEDGSFNFMYLNVQRQREVKRDLKMLQSDQNLTEKARARAIKRLEIDIEYKIIDGRLSINEFYNYFEIKNYEPELTNPVPDFFEELEICMLCNRERGTNRRLSSLCQFMFKKSEYKRNQGNPKIININEFELEQIGPNTKTNLWPDCFFCVDFQEKTLYLRYNSLRELEVLDPNNGNLDKLRQVLQRAIDGRDLIASDFWVPCPTTLEEAKKYLVETTDLSSPNESEEECPEE